MFLLASADSLRNRDVDLAHAGVDGEKARDEVRRRILGPQELELYAAFGGIKFVGLKREAADQSL